MTIVSVIFAALIYVAGLVGIFLLEVADAAERRETMTAGWWGAKVIVAIGWPVFIPIAAFAALRRTRSPW
ncbi:hypothetical protein L1787_16690 [Acuticoccus sp. M5D2P5]|uniref:hypothetical protein n=1 Tax=Acuticoccus kalidii TaxID=2910977 RepID=UPI001F3C5791|nr:hypothetical protein [Acuticoccus kalidii]MCF3935043.1 hypothetical protein [Acuticoccus kalidii]